MKVLKKRILVLGMILVLVMTNLSGCGLLSKVLGGGSKQTEEEKEEKTKDTKKKKKKKDKKKKDTEEEPEKEEAKQPEEIDVFEEMSGWCFCFCSGAGAWETSLRVESDGSFTGMYYDANMGETGPGYDDGTMYQCEFTGTFDSYEEVEPYIYTLHMSDLSFKNEPGEEEIIDNTLYIYTEPYGLEGVMDGTNDLQVYLAGAPTDALSEEAMTWIEPMHFSLYFGEDGYVNDVPEELPFPVLCNMGPEEAFFSDNVTYENKTYLVNKVQLPGLHPLTEELHEDGTYLYEDANDGATFIVRSACFELDGTYDIRQKAEDFVRACLAQVYDRPVTDLYVTAPNDLYSLQYSMAGTNGIYSDFAYWTSGSGEDAMSCQGRFYLSSNYESDYQFGYAYIIETDEDYRGEDPYIGLGYDYLTSLTFTGRPDKLSASGKGKPAVEQVLTSAVSSDRKDAIYAKEVIWVTEDDTDLIEKYDLDPDEFYDDYQLVEDAYDYAYYDLADDDTPIYVEFPEDGFHKLMHLKEYNDYTGSDDEGGRLLDLYLNEDGEVVFASEPYTP